MRLFNALKLISLLCAAICMAVPTQGAIVNWTDWTSATPGTPDTVTGVMGGVGVAYTGDYSFVELGTGTNFWTEPDPGPRPYTGNAVVDNAPTPSEMIALDAPSTHTIVFSQPATDPIMAIVSLGRSLSSWTVSYDFDTPFTVLSEGKGYWGDGSYSVDEDDYILYGNELHCAIQFQGTVSSITWVSAPSEYWHGFTVGAVPEPATITVWALLGTASCLGMGIWRRGRHVGRQPWSEENRTAIHDLIARNGRH